MLWGEMPVRSVTKVTQAAVFPPTDSHFSGTVNRVPRLCFRQCEHWNPMQKEVRVVMVQILSLASSPLRAEMTLTKKAEQSVAWSQVFLLCPSFTCLRSPVKQQNQQTWQRMYSLSGAGVICSVPTKAFCSVQCSHCCTERPVPTCSVLTAVFWKRLCFSFLPRLLEEKEFQGDKTTHDWQSLEMCRPIGKKQTNSGTIAASKIWPRIFNSANTDSMKSYCYSVYFNSLCHWCDPENLACVTWRCIFFHLCFYFCR